MPTPHPLPGPTVSEAAPHVRRGFLARLYFLLTASNTLLAVVVLLLTRPAARALISAHPLLALLVLPLRLGWWLSLAGWARTRQLTLSVSPPVRKLRAVLRATLNACVYILDAFFIGLLLVLALDLAESSGFGTGLYPAIGRVLFALWSSFLGSLVAILTTDTSTAPALRRIAVGAALGTTAASVALAFTGRTYDIPAVLLAPGIMHAILLRDLPRMMARFGPDEATLVAHVLGAPGKLALIQGLIKQPDVKAEKIDVQVASEKQEV